MYANSTISLKEFEKKKILKIERSRRFSKFHISTRNRIFEINTHTYIYIRIKKLKKRYECGS